MEGIDFLMDAWKERAREVQQLSVERLSSTNPVLGKTHMKCVPESKEDVKNKERAQQLRRTTTMLAKPPDLDDLIEEEDDRLVDEDEEKDPDF